MNKGHSEHTVDIPGEFYSFSSGALFDHCIDCDKYLLEKDTEYFIEKAIRQYEGYKVRDVIFEYAICFECADRVRREMSVESIQNVENFFMENVDMSRRMEIMMENPGNPQEWISHCLLKETSMNELGEFQLYAQCRGDKMEMGQMPYMISGAALEEIQHLLSSRTLDELNGFMDRHFGPPPDLMELLPSRRVVLI